MPYTNPSFSAFQGHQKFTSVAALAELEFILWVFQCCFSIYNITYYLLSCIRNLKSRHKKEDIIQKYRQMKFLNNEVKIPTSINLTRNPMCSLKQTNKQTREKSGICSQQQKKIWTSLYPDRYILGANIILISLKMEKQKPFCLLHLAHNHFFPIFSRKWVFFHLKGESHSVVTSGTFWLS